MLLTSIGLIATVLIVQEASALTDIESLNSDKSPQVKQAFITRVNQSTLMSSSTPPVVLTLPNSANYVIIIRNSSLEVNNDNTIECNPLKVGVRSDKRWYGSDIKLQQPFVQYRFTPDENNSEYMIMELKPNKDFVIFYLHNDDCKIGGSLVDITGVVAYTPLNDSSCPTQHNLTVFILNRTVCIDQPVHPIIKKRLLSMIPGTRFDLKNFTTPSTIINSTKGPPPIAWIIVPFVILIFVIAIVIILFQRRKKHKRRKTSIELVEMKPLLPPLPGKEEGKKLRKSFTRLKGILNESFKSFKFSDSFSESIKSAVQTRNNNVKKIKKFLKDNLSEGKLETLWIKEALNICDEVVESKVTLVFLGRLNSGKSTLITRLIENKFSLPIGEDPTTSRITRLVYSDRCYIKKVKIKEYNQKFEICKEEDGDEDELKLNENLQQYELSSNEKLKRYFDINQRRNENEEYKTTIIEIGLPIEILEKMILIDFPGLEENQELSEMDLETLEVLKPTIICYMYTYLEGFTMVDAKCCDKISKSLISDIRNDVQYILLANKFDLSFGNEYDFTEVDIFERKEEYLDCFQNEENKLIRYLCKFKDSNSDICIPYSDQIEIEKQKWFKFDKDRLLPALPLSVKKGVDDDNSDSLFQKFEKDIIMKIINQSRAILINISEYVGAAAINKEVKMNLWYKLKSLSMDEQLLHLIDNPQENENVLFSDDQHQVFGKEFLSGQVHITKVTCTSSDDQSDPHKLRIFDERNGKLCRNRSGSSSFVYECDDESTIYLIDKEMPHQKFSDFWNSNIDKECWIKILLHFVVTEYHYLGEFKPNFCVDNLFIDEDMEIICANRSFLNDSPPTFDKIDEQNSYDHHNFGISEEFSSFFKFMNSSFSKLIKLISEESPTQISSDRISSMLKYMQTCCLSLQKKSLFYRHWDLIIKIFKMTVETEEPLNEVPDLTSIPIPPTDDKFTYSGEMRNRSNVDILTSDGSWIFRPKKDEEGVTWQLLGNGVEGRGRNILLPTEMFGIIVFIRVKMVRACSQEELQIQLVACNGQDDKKQLLPLCVTIQVDIELPSYANRTNLYRSHWTNLYRSHKHRFRIEQFSEMKNAEPDNFFIPFRKKYIKPKMNLKLKCNFCH